MHFVILGRDADGYGGVHCGMGFRTRNAEGERILEFGDAVDMVVCNTFFKKEDSKLITYQSGDNRSMIDYLMVRKTDRCLVKDVKVISSEECVPQHRMVIGRLVLPMKPQKKKIVKFVPKPRVWKLKDEVCGMTKGPPQHKKTWWWNRDVENVVAKRKVCHKAWQKSKSAEDKHALDVAKKEVYTAVMTAKESKLQEFTADLQSESGRKNCFRIAKQMAREGRDVISVCCMKNDAGNVVSDADGMKNIWKSF